MTGMSYTPIEIYDSEEEKNQYYGNRISMICVEDPYLEDDEMSTEEDEKEVSDSIPSRKVDWYWLSRIKQLEEYREKWGHCKVPLKDKDLGSFVHRTRKKYNKGTLAEHKINQLDKLGYIYY